MLPTIAISRVTHIGLLDQRPAPKKSHEGSCLSVSQEPDAWSYIARLGGRPWWNLTKKEGRFVDYYKLTPEHRQLLGAKASELVTSQVRMVDQGKR